VRREEDEDEDDDEPFSDSSSPESCLTGTGFERKEWLGT
jgi:hypothetical protein